MKYKCTCGDSECTTGIHTEEPNIITPTDKDGNESLMYVDANTVVALIKALKSLLNSMVGQEE